MRNQRRSAMNYTRFLSAAVIASCIVLPSAAQAQSLQSKGLGNGGYGIFGDGSNINGSYNGSASGNGFGRNYAYSQSQVGNFAQQAYSGSYVQPLGRYGLGANGSGSNLSPYLNLLRPG